MLKPFGSWILLALVGAIGVHAQQRRQPPPPTQPRDMPSSTLQVQLPPPVAETPAPFGIPSPDGHLVQPLNFVSPELSFERNTVKGAPFTADSTIDHIQTLRDGNRLVRRSTARIFRDSEGRTRREHMLEGRVAGSAEGEWAYTITIYDPIALVSYFLDPETRTVRRATLPQGFFTARSPGQNRDGNSAFGILVSSSVARRLPPSGRAGESTAPPVHLTRERLESDFFEGILVEKTRAVFTVAAGEFDNEQPLLITQEQWYSPELQVVVFLSHNDPRFGETIFRLTNIVRGEPESSLFAPPSDYGIVERGVPVPPRRLPHQR